MSRRNNSLDGLRALCVLLVFGSGFHWLLPFGWIGVQIFYVLSGYLITEILNHERLHTTQTKAFFSRFYIRRSIRIFPLYFAYLAALHVTSSFEPNAVPDWNVARWYAATFTTNIGFVLGAIRISDAIGHLWSLAVEEQFYLVWPWLVWLMPPQTLTRLAFVLVLFGPVLRWFSAYAFGFDHGQTYLSSTSHLDAFACGALVPWLNSHVRPLRALTGAAFAVTAGLGGFLIVSEGLALRTLGYPEGLYVGQAHLWGYTAINITTTLLIACLVRGYFPRLGHPALAYVGQISYGIYLFQRPIKGVYLATLEPQILNAMPTWIAYATGACLCLALATLLAAISYRFFERPLLTWRDRVAPRAQAENCL